MNERYICLKNVVPVLITKTHLVKLTLYGIEVDQSCSTLLSFCNAHVYLSGLEAYDGSNT